MESSLSVRVAVALSTVGVVMLVSACGGATAHRPVASTLPVNRGSQRQLARQIVAVVVPFDSKLRNLVEPAYLRIFHTAGRCAPGFEKHYQIEGELEQEIGSLMVAQTIAPTAEKLAARLSAFDPTSPTLRLLIRRFNDSTADAEKLAAISIDPCQVLRDWRASGWTRAFANSSYYGLLHKAGVKLPPRTRTPLGNVRSDQGVAIFVGLEKLGIDLNTALEATAVPWG